MHHQEVAYSSRNQPLLGQIRNTNKPKTRNTSVLCFVMSIASTSSLAGPLTRRICSRTSASRSALVFSTQPRFSKFFFAATAISVLTSSRAMTTAATGTCANPAGAVPSSVQTMATDILQASWLLIDPICFAYLGFSVKSSHLALSKSADRETACQSSDV